LSYQTPHLARIVASRSEPLVLSNAAFVVLTGIRGRYSLSGFAVYQGPTLLIQHLRYTALMTRLVIAVWTLSFLSLPAVAQAKVHIRPQHQTKHETIHATIENAGSTPITFCIEVSQTSPRGGGETETTPSPFWVQRNDNGKWSTLMIGPDMGSLKTREVLDAGKSIEFPFRLGDSGQMRVQLNYWNGSLPSLNCHAPPKGAKSVTSAVFTVE
jgi:hypothetical protein